MCAGVPRRLVGSSVMWSAHWRSLDSCIVHSAVLHTITVMLEHCLQGTLSQDRMIDLLSNNKLRGNAKEARHPRVRALPRFSIHLPQRDSNRLTGSRQDWTTGWTYFFCSNRQGQTTFISRAIGKMYINWTAHVHVRITRPGKINKKNLFYVHINPRCDPFDN